MVLIDSSAWIEFFRRTGSPTNRSVIFALSGQPLTTAPVRMELLAGAQDEDAWVKIASALRLADTLPCLDDDFEYSADLYRDCRRAGETPRNHIDCLIAAAAISNDVELLHNDRDFDVLARHTPLRATRG